MTEREFELEQENKRLREMVQKTPFSSTRFGRGLLKGVHAVFQPIAKVANAAGDRLTDPSGTATADYLKKLTRLTEASDVENIGKDAVEKLIKQFKKLEHHAFCNAVINDDDRDYLQGRMTDTEMHLHIRLAEATETAKEQEKKREEAAAEAAKKIQEMLIETTSNGDDEQTIIAPVPEILKAQGAKS